MGVTININGLSLCHKGSGGIATATVPDVCKTPSPGGPVPIPYPNIAFSKNLAKGTKTIKVDGGNMAANKGSEFSRSIGDEPGTVGGVKSGVNMKEATWLSYSFNVKFEGKNVCRLTDKMLMNHGNAVCLGGLQQIIIIVAELEILCKIICFCNENPIISPKGRKLKEKCVETTLNIIDTSTAGNSTLKAEQTYDMWTSPPNPLAKRTGVKGQCRIMDVVSVIDPALPATQDNLKAVYEIKFPGDREAKPRMGNSQYTDCRNVAGNAHFEVLTVEKCCPPEPEPEPVTVPEFELQWYHQLQIALLLAAAAAIIADDITGVGAADDPLLIPIAARLAQLGVKFAF
ncbi:DUF4150 domain-containing protein [Desulfococcaceae bacterium HSG9]|nr:DUF4150 domain-containing protein [Desulfococcaceae bacterium HSG9]